MAGKSVWEYMKEGAKSLGKTKAAEAAPPPKKAEPAPPSKPFSNLGDVESDIKKRGAELKKVDSYKKGGKVKKTGLARLHKNERVLTTSQTKKLEKKPALMKAVGIKKGKKSA